ncbi:helix-turn-helix domain-containing protein [Chryseobacterium rhizosphaerae]|uniref:helix-turn-helix domain-containing protein n=1 Tax=Chryseobacterium rhizosphaerae TaxID=395937 RepID=UPI003D0AF653
MEDSFGKRLESIMLERGFNKNSLAREAKMHPTTLKNWIDNATVPDDLKLDTIIKFLGTTRSYLYTGKGNRFSQESTEINTQKNRSSFNELPIGDQLAKIYANQLSIETKLDKVIECIDFQGSLDDKLNKVVDYIDKHLDPLFEYMEINPVESRKEKTKK